MKQVFFYSMVTSQRSRIAFISSSLFCKAFDEGKETNKLVKKIQCKAFGTVLKKYPPSPETILLSRRFICRGIASTNTRILLKNWLQECKNNTQFCGCWSPSTSNVLVFKCQGFLCQMNEHYSKIYASDENTTIF